MLADRLIVGYTGRLMESFLILFYLNSGLNHVTATLCLTSHKYDLRKTNKVMKEKPALKKVVSFSLQDGLVLAVYECISFLFLLLRNPFLLSDRLFIHQLSLEGRSEQPSLVYFISFPCNHTFL